MDSTTPLRVAPLPGGGMRPVLEGRPEVAGQSLGLAPGVAVEARIVGRLSRDSVLLEIAGQLFQTDLPESVAHDGPERLPLIVLRGGDKPAFLLDRAGAEPAASPSTRVELSALASRLGAAVAAATKGQEAVTALSAEALPILEAPPSDAEGLVPPLRQAVERSGLFYESHQAEWVAGRRSLEALRAEPQAAAVTKAAQADETSPQPAGDRTEASVPTAASSGQSVTADTADAAPALPPVIAHLVDRQLQTLSGQPVLWTGQVWPGQAMEWIIEEDSTPDPDETASDGWISRMRLTLPTLGEVELRIGLRDDRLTVRVVSGEAHVASFRDSADVLRTALAARGLALTAFDAAPLGDTG